MTECSRCGDCCENIHLSTTKKHLREVLTWVDPDKDPEAWLKVGWSSIENAKRYRADARFILDHWHSTGRSETPHRHVFGCDRFDPETRLCTAHDERPPICSGFPWYEREPSQAQAEKLPARCSFLADVPVTLTGKAG